MKCISRGVTVFILCRSVKIFFMVFLFEFLLDLIEHGFYISIL